MEYDEIMALVRKTTEMRPKLREIMEGIRNVQEHYDMTDKKFIELTEAFIAVADVDSAVDKVFDKLFGMLKNC